VPEFINIKKRILYEDIANEIERMIIENTLPTNSKLPSEQKLAEMLGVSRNILREALKTLKERGLISVKTGNGIYVDKPGQKVLQDVLKRFVYFQNVPLNEVFEIRFSIEVSACGLAAARAGKKDLLELENLIREMKKSINNVSLWSDVELRFHLSIAKSTKNPLFLAFIQTLTNMLSELFEKGYYKKNAIEHGIMGHENILEAIKSKDIKRAKQAMVDHLETSKQLLLDLKGGDINTLKDLEESNVINN